MTADPSSSRSPWISSRAARWLLRRDAKPQLQARYVPDLRVDVVHDPFGKMHMISVRGPITPLTVLALAIRLEAVPDHAPLHLDVTDAVVSDQLVMRYVERLIDALEHRFVRVRIVGLDPASPALADHWRS